MIATLGRLDRLNANGQLDASLQSGARFSESVMVLSAHREGKASGVSMRRIGPARIFGRTWEELKIPQVLRHLFACHRLMLSVERILLLSVLHRMFVSRAASGHAYPCARLDEKQQRGHE